METLDENIHILLKQYYDIKKQHPDALLLFRTGDMYKAFGDDAKIVSGILEVRLVREKTGAISHTYLTGFEHTSIDLYLPMLIKAGYRVAICDELANPREAKDIKREVAPPRDLFA